MRSGGDGTVGYRAESQQTRPDAFMGCLPHGGEKTIIKVVMISKEVRC